MQVLIGDEAQVFDASIQLEACAIRLRAISIPQVMKLLRHDDIDNVEVHGRRCLWSTMSIIHMVVINGLSNTWKGCLRDLAGDANAGKPSMVHLATFLAELIQKEYVFRRLSRKSQLALLNAFFNDMPVSMETCLSAEFVGFLLAYGQTCQWATPPCHAACPQFQWRISPLC